MTDAELVAAAIAEAVASVAEGGGPFGAVVARRGAIVARGRNRVVATGDPTAHAEIEAIRAAARALGTHELAGCTLYASCEPCPMCLGATLWSRADRVRYAATRDDAARAGFDDARFHQAFGTAIRGPDLPLERVPTDDAGSPFEAWRAKSDRVPY